MKKQFFSAVIPSVLAFALSGVYAVVDAFFVGNFVGDAGLAAINLAWPVTAFFQALGTGLGMGGAVRFSIASGQGDKTACSRFFTLTLLLLMGTGLLCTLLLPGCASALLWCLGAKGQLMIMGQQYLRIICLGAFFQVLGTGFTPLIRNLGGSLWAMFAMIAGFITNILLDGWFIFVLKKGIAGAALATVIAQMITAVFCLFGLLRHRDLFTRRFSGRPLHYLCSILLVGLSPFGLAYSHNIALILMNRAAIGQGGEEAVTCYATLSYMTCVAALLLQGVSDGCQPLMSRCFGHSDPEQLKQVERLAYGFAQFLAFVCLILLYTARFSVPRFFGTSASVSRQVSLVLPLFLAGLPFTACGRITTSRLYATGCNGAAYLLIYGEPLILAILTLCLPLRWHLWGVWLAEPLSCAFSAAAGLLLSHLLRQQSRRAAAQQKKPQNL